jgi:4,5-dihydroxyphthalate decarboxylase
MFVPEIELSLAISYYEHVSDLLRGRVRTEGIRLATVDLPVEEIFFRMLSFVEWDVAEFSMAKYVSLVGSGVAPFRAIPVFPSRMFRQSAFYVARGAGILCAGDLAGRRVGIPEWAQTAGIYARAYLQHQCGVRLRDIHWVQAGVNQPGRIEKVLLSLPEGVTIEHIHDRSLNEMLLSGELDAVISAREPSAFTARNPGISRLWPDHHALEEAYYRETGIFPIMHVIVIKAATLDHHPWIAMNLFEAFEEAKDNSLRYLSSSLKSRIPIPWSHERADEARAMFGDDFWPYGIEPNRHTLGAFLLYCHEQGVTKRPVQIEELFPAQLGRFFKA